MPKPEMKVLVVEDDYREAQGILDNLKSLEVFKANLNSHIVHTTHDAIRETSSGAYDLVLLDLTLTERGSLNDRDYLSGNSILAELKRRSPATKFVIYTNYLPLNATREIQPLSYEADYIFKKPDAAEFFNEGLASALRNFLPKAGEADHKPKAELIVPVRETLTVVNNRITALFRRNPEWLRTIDPFTFEQVIADLFAEEGYEVALTPPRADGGKDIYVSKTDPLTQTLFLVECKRYTPPTKVGVEVVRQLYGVVQQERASGGVVVTTSYFTKPAIDFANTVPYQLFLRDFDNLVEWLKKSEKDSLQGRS